MRQIKQTARPCRWCNFSLLSSPLAWLLLMLLLSPSFGKIPGGRGMLARQATQDSAQEAEKLLAGRQDCIQD